MSMQQHKGAVLWSLVLHVAVVAGLSLGIKWPERPRVQVAAAPIQGTIIDTATLERQQQAREETARQERQRQQRQDNERRQAEEQRRQAQQREEQRVAAEQRARDEAAQKERDRVAADKAAAERREQQAREERERQAAAEKERQAREQREREEAAKRERERVAAAAQRQRESELSAAAALEAEANAAREAGLYDQYVFAIQQRIMSKWQRPLSARPGIECVVTVVQLPSGVVVSAKVASCNGDDAVRSSIERAVLAASPLPTAPSPGLYERIVNVRFEPAD